MNIRTAAAVTVLLVLPLTACSSAKPHEAPRIQNEEAIGRATVSVRQFQLDSGFLPPEFWDGAHDLLVNPDGTMALTADMRAFWSSRGNTYLGPNRPYTMDEVQTRTAGLLQLVPGLQKSSGRPKGPTLTREQGAHAVLAQELADAGCAKAQDFDADDAGVVAPGTAAIDDWIAAHGQDPICPTSHVTVAVEAGRVLDFVTRPTQGFIG
ncbi:hypothetical protein [Kitasatospora viridis]|uniref:Uncharacterized protein n=1 Tax=Kitasatospora viridis TaxID=281105 RepID=A0A561TVN8_9ACTN|nr:hypothetical protein [Kitasatospora viridis]TWF91175.1 hypothetical protein FHX73_12287 [Kitasatospora viridis]